MTDDLGERCWGFVLGGIVGLLTGWALIPEWLLACGLAGGVLGAMVGGTVVARVAYWLPWQSRSRSGSSSRKHKNSGKSGEPVGIASLCLSWFYRRSPA